MNKNFVKSLSLEELRSLKKDVDERIQREDPEIERFFYFIIDTGTENQKSYEIWLGHGKIDRTISYYFKTKNNRIYTKNNSLQDYWEISLKEFIDEITKVHERIDKEDLSKIKTEILRIRRELNAKYNKLSR
jgi:hypothetical protein